VEEIERKISRISDSFADLYNAAVVSGLDTTSPALFEHLERARLTIVSDSGDSQHGSPYLSGTDYRDSTPSQVFGHRFLRDKYGSSEAGKSTLQVEQSLDISPYPATPRNTSDSLEQTVCYTYCFQESTLSRRLQRCCLEHAFHLFSDSRCNPQEIYHVFRLVPCITDREKMYPRFEQLLRGGSDDPLEIPSLPFYCIGGAGTHYPSESGNPVYPSNMRRPRRVLGILPTSQAYGASRMDTDELLGICGLGGQWFDSRDVEGYLEENGVSLGDSCLFPSVDGKQRHRDGQECSCSSLSQEPIRHVPAHDGMGVCPPRSHCQRVSYTLDIRRFFSSKLSSPTYFSLTDDVFGFATRLCHSRPGPRVQES
jgi:hypothetical protein